MNTLITDQSGGFPLTLDKTLGFMQDNYTLLQEFGKGLCGTAPAILSGCVVTGGNVSDGVVIIAGEVLPFEGGPIGAKVAIEETVINKPYEDGISRPAYKVRKAKFAAIGTNWSDFNSIINRIIPAGIVMMWAGSVSDIPAGFRLCDGTSGTPDLKHRFIVGYDASMADYNSIGKTGGQEKVKLTYMESGLPPHNHTYYRAEAFENKSGSGNASPTASTLTVTSTEGGQDAALAHENRPPFYVLAYIIKV